MKQLHCMVSLVLLSLQMTGEAVRLALQRHTTDAKALELNCFPLAAKKEKEMELHKREFGKKKKKKINFATSF